MKEEYETEMNHVWHAATTKELRAKWIETIQQLNLQYKEATGQGTSQIAASLPGVEDSQASVIQVNPPDRPDPLPTVGEGTDSSTTESTSSSGATSSSSSAAPPDTRPPIDTRRQNSEPLPEDDSNSATAEPQPEHTDLLTPTLPRTSLLNDSESESGASRGPSRMRSMSTKVSSREEVDSHVLVEDSQPKSDEDASQPSVLFSSDQPEVDMGDAAVPDTVHELSEDDELAGPIHLSDHAPNAVLRAAQISSTNSKRNSSQFGSSPPREPPSSPTRQSKKPRSSRKSVPDGFKQQTLLEYRVNGAGSPSTLRPATPETKELKEPVGPPAVSAPARARNQTYKDKGKKRAVSGSVATGGERKRARSNTAGPDEQGTSSQNPIDLDPDSGSE